MIAGQLQVRGPELGHRDHFSGIGSYLIGWSAAVRASLRAKIGITIHCNSGDKPVFINGTTGIRLEYPQFALTTIFNHSLKIV